MPYHLFIYGSLLSARSRSRTLGQTHPIMSATLQGYQRVWNRTSPQLGGGICYLGLEAASDANCHGGVLSLNEEAFQKIAAREKGYTLTEISQDSLQLETSFDDNPIVTFTNNSATRPDARFPIVQSYLDLCLEGLIEMSSNHKDAVDRCIQFLNETTGWSKHWINDRVHARRPQVEYPPALIIDQAISRGLPDYLTHIRIPS